MCFRYFIFTCVEPCIQSFPCSPHPELLRLSRRWLTRGLASCSNGIRPRIILIDPSFHECLFCNSLAGKSTILFELSFQPDSVLCSLNPSILHTVTPYPPPPKKIKKLKRYHCRVVLHNSQHIIASPSLQILLRDTHC